jgi:hypothetical protein
MRIFSDNGVKVVDNGVLNHCGEAFVGGAAYIFIGNYGEYNSASLSLAGDGNFFVEDNAEVVIRNINISGTGNFNYRGSSKIIYENMTPPNSSAFSWFNVGSITSSSSFSLGSASGSMTVSPNSNFFDGFSVILYLDANNYQVTSVVGSLGISNLLNFAGVKYSVGSGTYSNWKILPLKNRGIAPPEVADITNGPSPIPERITNPSYWELKQNGFYLNDWCYTILPLDLFELTGVYLKKSREVQLDWSQVPKENSFYIVERAEDSSLKFKEIGSVIEPNAGEFLPSFMFLDKNPPGYDRYIYYRIKQVDLGSGNTFYTKVIAVFIDEIADDSQRWLLYPNPVDSFNGFQLRYVGENKNLASPISFSVFCSGITLGPYLVKDQFELNQKIRSLFPLIPKGMNILRISASDDITHLKFFVR